MKSKKRPEKNNVHGEFTLEEIGEAMGGISREAVRQIQENAFRKIRKELFKRGLRPSDLFED